MCTLRLQSYLHMPSLRCDYSRPDLYLARGHLAKIYKRRQRRIDRRLRGTWSPDNHQLTLFDMTGQLQFDFSYDI
jgi:hypothetical protein